jgi:hypothetical protein
MLTRITLALAALAASTAFGQPVTFPGSVDLDAYQINYAANLNAGDSTIILTNTGVQGQFAGATPPTQGNICVNVYTFDAQEEEISCCSCLVSPNGLDSLSAKNDLINNTLTPAVPTSIVVKLVASQPGTTMAGAFTICNPTSPVPAIANIPYGPSATGSIAAGMRAWMNTTESESTAGTYGTVHGSFLPSYLYEPELNALTSVCGFIQGNGSGFGICGSCQLGALNGARQ